MLKDNRLRLSFYSRQSGYLVTAWSIIGSRPVGHFTWRKLYASGTHSFGYRHNQAYLLAEGKPPRLEKPIGDVLD